MKNTITTQTIQHYWQASTKLPRLLFLACIFIPLNAICLNTLLPFFIGKLLAGLNHSPQAAEHYLPFLIATAFCGVVANYVGFKALFSHQPRTMEKLGKEALDTLLKRSVGFHNNHIGGKLINDASDYVQSYHMLSNVLFTAVLPFMVSLLSGIVIVFLNSFLLGCLVVVMTVSIVSFALWQTTRNTANRERRHAARRDVVAHQADVISNAVTVKTFAKETNELAEHQRLSHQLALFRERDWNKVASDGSLRISLLLLFEIAFILLIIYLVAQNPALLGIGIFTFSYVLNLGNRLFDIGTIFRNIEDALLEARDITEIMYSEPEIVDKRDAQALRITKGAVKFDNIAFRYNDAGQNDAVFENLSLEIKPGEKVGLVGPSGGGKSTLSRLLLRFDDIDSGAISIDAQHIADVTQDSLRQKIAYVPQEPLLFHRSIAENISYGKPDATEAEIEIAATQAYALDFIKALPSTFGTIVGERGVKLSGGQRQRIAIARAILKNAPVLVLDEATSALDSESEVLIQDALWKLMEGRTAIVIAHRLSTIQKMDRIIVLDNGKIVEQGSHKELLAKKNGTYAKLWAHQSGGFIED